MAIFIPILNAKNYEVSYRENTQSFYYLIVYILKKKRTIIENKDKMITTK